MNVILPNIPKRPLKPRNSGITMVMDKGLGLRNTEDFIEVCGHLVDFVKLGFGTSVVTNNLEKKINLYKSAGLTPYFGGTLFEAFIARNMFDEYVDYLDKYGVTTVEVSDGSMVMSHKDKCSYIEKLAKKYTVISEVGSKNADVHIPAEKWVEMMQNELNAGAFKVIAEARESGNVGIYQANGAVDDNLITTLLENIDGDKILWETPNKSQQIFFIKLLGTNVNLGNIAYNEVIPLETLRLGLRGDTFDTYL